MNRLITIRMSHFCEKARWGLERARIPYTEEAHAPLFQIPHALFAGQRRTVPVLITEHGEVFPDSEEILRFADRDLDEGDSLYPAGLFDAEAAQLQMRLNKRLGPHVRRIAYAFSLEDRDLILPYATHRAPLAERWAARAIFPVARALLRRFLEINERSVARSLEIARGIYREVEERLDDGRKYILGDRLSALDVTFAALSGPLVYPPSFGSPLPRPERMQKDWRHVVEEFRAMPGGQFVARLFRDEREKVVAAKGAAAAH